ncbi:ABC transporter ATP-binding protein [Isoptericola cucumis]|uniref:Dipeptide/oligopeptide/nickel ABC transporter ATP-binding protein n=1 Tax=Isoptericola cucumis TaxID=1776856 RepID=A0ABQ2BAS0_9MICO|nr:ABC transporter ATP-binding protein [Isoptericola cucumis]GGI11895.1 dipeptide/oligopeptide/nickel ABC transporter ATP-binding protein [Isoptericola cucumis]
MSTTTTKRPGPATGEVVLEAHDLVKDFRGKRAGLRRTRFRAVDHVSLALRTGQVTALVGQSGSGKSTVGRLLARLVPATSGEILLRGRPVTATHGRRFVEYTSTVQMTLQDPFASLNPVHRISHVLERSLRIHGHAATAEEVEHQSLELLRRVNLTPPERYLHRFPHELSGGERQRVSFARALAAQPQVLLADEPVSMLDVTIRKEILDLLADLRRTEDLAVLYITHDLGSARAYSDDTVVMYHGQVVERGPSHEVIDDPQHEYTRRLLAAAPNPRRRLDAR